MSRCRDILVRPGAQVIDCQIVNPFVSKVGRSGKVSFAIDSVRHAWMKAASACWGVTVRAVQPTWSEDKRKSTIPEPVVWAASTPIAGCNKHLNNSMTICFPCSDCLLPLEGTRRVLAVEERGGLLERPILRLDDEEVQEHGLEREPAAVHDL